MALFLNLPVTTTEDIALAVRAELATELARVDVAVSTRAPETDTDAILAALGGTVQPSGEVE